MVVCHKEREYACRLSNYLNQHSDGDFIALAVTDVEQVQEVMLQQELAVLLVEEDCEQEVTKMVKQDIRLCYFTKKQQAHKNSVYMYASAEELLDRVKKELGAVHNFGEEMLEIEALIDFARTSLPSDEIRKIGENHLLYWEWKPFSSFLSEQNLEGFLYDIKRHKKEVEGQLKKYLIYQENCAILPAPAYCMDMRALSVEDIRWFLRVIGEKGFSGICMGIDFSCLGSLDILTIFSKITLVLPGEEWLKSLPYQSVLNYFKHLNIAESKIEYEIVNQTV